MAATGPDSEAAGLFDDDPPANQTPEIPPEKLAEYKAVELLVRREHTRAELARKLRKRDHSSEAIEIALDVVAERGWQSDRRFAELFVQQRTNRGNGPQFIQQELRKRGVSSADNDWAMSGAEADWEQVAAHALANRFMIGDDYGKMRRFLERRGFDSSQARFAIKALNDAPS